MLPGLKNRRNVHFKYAGTSVQLFRTQDTLLAINQEFWSVTVRTNKSAVGKDGSAKGQPCVQRLLLNMNTRMNYGWKRFLESEQDEECHDVFKDEDR